MTQVVSFLELLRSYCASVFYDSVFGSDAGKYHIVGMFRSLTKVHGNELIILELIHR